MAKKIKMSPSYAGAMGEELIKSGVFTEEEIAKLWVSLMRTDKLFRSIKIQMKPDKPYSEIKRMRDPERGINSKKFMADRGMYINNLTY